MTLIYMYILCISACVDSISPNITVSARMGSTVLLPCNLTNVSTQTSFVQWCTGDKVVFERSGGVTHVGSGYEDRVVLPEDELHKGNCSLVLKNVRLTDDDFYNSFRVKYKDGSDQWIIINKVELSVDVLQNISAAVGSTVILPCEWRDLSIQIAHVLWHISREVVFERQGKESFPGEGYEGRVDVFEDELLKGNCSLVLSNISISDEGVYRSSMVVKHPKKPVLVQKVQLSVYNKSEKKAASLDRSKEIKKDKNSSDNGVKNFHYLWILVILPGLLLGLAV